MRKFYNSLVTVTAEELTDSERDFYKDLENAGIRNSKILNPSNVKHVYHVAHKKGINCSQRVEFFKNSFVNTKSIFDGSIRHICNPYDSWTVDPLTGERDKMFTKEEN